MMDGGARRQLGALGEKIAGDYLVGRGHTILERNWRRGHLEVDIITEAPDGIHFVEVKSRMAPVAEDPTVNVDRAKRANITRAALHYLNHNLEGREMEAFFDIVSVVFDGGRSEIDYYPSAWIPMYT